MTTTRGILYLVGHDLPARLKPQDVNCSATIYRLWATKIGKTKSPSHASVDKRITSMNTGNPFGLITKSSIPCNSPGKWEKYFHKYFSAKRVRNEWLALDSTDFKFIQDTIKLHEETGKGPNCALFEEIMFEDNYFQKLALDRKTTPKPSATVDKYIIRGIRIKHEKLAKKHGRSYLDNDETEILHEVIQGHPDAPEKIGVGIRNFFVAEAKGLHTYCFHVERVDGSEEDFSYLACFGHSLTRRIGYTHIREPSPRY